MKQRFTTLDLVAVVAELQKTVVGLRLHNVYDIDGKTYLLKFASGEKKHLLYIQSGTRMHLTAHEWAKNAMPGGFSMKLRKHVRQKRLESVTQLGIDRVVDMQFGSGEMAFHLIIELYDRGNMVLTDHAYKILILLRKRVDEVSDSHFEQDARYPIDVARKEDQALLGCEVLRERCREYVSSVSKVSDEAAAEQAEVEKDAKSSKKQQKKAVQRGKSRTTLSSVLNTLFPFGTHLIVHALLEQGIRDSPIEPLLDDAAQFDRVAAAMNHAREIFDQIRSGAHTAGYIVKRRRTTAPANEEAALVSDLSYEEYHPYKFAQLTKCVEENTVECETLASFNAAADEFYSQAERLRVAQRTTEKRTAATRKLENVRRDHEDRVRQLENEVRACHLKASTIELHAELVDKTIRIVNSLVAQQLGWEAIEEQVEAARRLNDPVATRIEKLLLASNQVALKFPSQTEGAKEAAGEAAAQSEPSNVAASKANIKNRAGDKTARRKRAGVTTQQEEEGGDSSTIIVEIDLGMSAYANVERYFELQKRAAEKAKRTIAASSDALRNAQRSYTAEMVATQRDMRILQRVAANASAAKRTLWFEKFRWFISSDCYLVLAGATQSQNETLVKHYLRARDIYVHADLHGAASVVIKNPKGGPIPPRTLEEAGDFALCNSAAWESRLVSNAWWVYADQVSKTPPTGMYVSAGSFIIRGKKNYLRPTSLLFGFAFLFRLAPESIERRKRLATSESDAQQVDLGQHQPEEEDEDEDEQGEDQESQSQANEARAADTVGRQIDDDQDDEDAEAERLAEARLAELCVNDRGTLTDDEKQQSADKSQSSSKVAQSRESASAPSQSSNSAAKIVDRTDSVTSAKRVMSRAERKRQKKERGDRVSESSSVAASGNAVDTEKQDASDEDEDKDQRPASTPAAATSGSNAAKNGQAQNSVLKRGQRSKLKKIKERYADQDEEERALRMNILKGVGTARSEKKQKEKEEQEQRARVAKEKAERAKQKREAKEKQLMQSSRARQAEEAQTGEKNRDSDDELDDALSESEEEEQRPDQLTELLLSLANSLQAEDVALQAIPVCAPYAALNRYKFKVKLQPGTTKRSKAVKFALDVFLQDKNATDLEKALIKAIVEQDLSRNFPGKVKVSAPNLLRLHTNAKSKSAKTGKKNLA